MDNKMIRIIAFSLLIMGAVTMSAQKGEYHAKPYAGLTPRDGKAYLDIMHYDDKSKFMYLISNDDINLYIDILIGDPAAIQRTMMFGLTTWLDTLGKKKKNTGIVFPVEGGPGRGMEQTNGRAEGKGHNEMMALTMQEKNSRMLLKGFDGKGAEKEINPLISPGVRGKIERMEGEKLRLTLAIPLAMIGRAGRAISHPLSIGFETGYMDLNQSGMAMGGGSRSDGGGYHGGGPPGGGPPGGGGDMDRKGGKQRVNLNELATPSKMWVKKVYLHITE